MSAGGSVLVVDVGTSGVRAGIVRPDASVTHVHHAPVLPDSPAPGLVEFDAGLMAEAVLAVARATLDDGGPVDAVGIANQRASTIVWDRASGAPLAPGIGWQDLRTVGTCLVLQGEGIRLAPNASATKLMAILDAVDPDRVRASAGELCFGTVDTWVAWTLSGGAAAGDDALHVTDATNAAVTALVDAATILWDEALLERLNIPSAMLPRIVDSSGAVGASHALAGAPVICGIAGDQQASLVGQGCTRPGLAKATFGTGGMLDQCTGPDVPPTHAGQGRSGTFPIVAYQVGGRATWGVEAVMLSAGTCVEWLRDDLEILTTSEESATVAAQCATTGDVWFVPALLGMGTPVWDFGARASRSTPCASTAACRTTMSSSRRWPMPSGDRWRSRRCSRPPPSVRACWPGWPSAPTPTRTTWPARSRPAGRWNRATTRPPGRTNGSGGCWPGPRPRPPSRNCRASVSDQDP